jgi:hypothetical protein
VRARAVQVVALTLWIGAAGFFVSVVAQAVFAVLPTRSLAGELVGQILPSVFYSGMVVAAAVIVIEWRTAVINRLLVVSAVLTFIACAGAQLGVSSRIETHRATIGVPIDRIESSDPRRIRFGQLHALSVGLLGLAGVAAVVADVIALRKLVSGPSR